MLHLRSNARFVALLPQILEILSQVPPNQTTSIVLPSWTQGLNDDLRPQLRKSLTTHLFGWPNLLSLRMRLSIADQCWVRESRASNSIHLQYLFTETMQGPGDAGTVRSSRTRPASRHLTLRPADPGSSLESHHPRYRWCADSPLSFLIR